MYKEPAQLFGTRKFNERYPLYEKQINGEMLSPDEEHKEWFAHGTQNAVWDDVKIVQDSSDHYSLSKRTGKDYAWVGMLHGSRAKGLCYAGGKMAVWLSACGISLRNILQHWKSQVLPAAAPK